MVTGRLADFLGKKHDNNYRLFKDHSNLTRRGNVYCQPSRLLVSRPFLGSILKVRRLFKWKRSVTIKVFPVTKIPPPQPPVKDKKAAVKFPAWVCEVMTGLPSFPGNRNVKKIKSVFADTSEGTSSRNYVSVRASASTTIITRMNWTDWLTCLLIYSPTHSLSHSLTYLRTELVS